MKPTPHFLFFLLALFIPLAASATPVFLWRPLGDSSASPSWLSSVTAGSSIVKWIEQGPVAGASDRFGYYRFKNFSNSYLKSNAVPDFDNAQDLTLQVWFRPEKATSSDALLSTLTSKSGFFLGLSGGYLTASVYIGTKKCSVTASSWHVVTEGEWHVAALRVDKSSSGFFSSIFGLKLFFDGDEVGSAICSNYGSYAINHGTEKLYIGAHSQSSQRSTWRFEGDIHAVIADDKAYDESALEIPVPFDNTPYLGRPDYLDGDFETVEERISSADSDIHPVTYLPFQNLDYITQGVASACEGGQSCDENYIYLSMYWKNKDGETADDADEYNVYKSLIVELDPDNSYGVRRCFALAGDLQYSHVGGLAYYKGNLYVPSTISGKGYVEKYVLPDEDDDLFEKSGCVALSAQKKWHVKAEAFVSYGKIDGVNSLLVGRYCTKSWGCEYEDGSTANAYAYQYELDSSGDIVSSESDPYDEFVTKFAIPSATQGIAVGEDDGQTALVFSTSNGDVSSEIEWHKLDSLECPKGNSCDFLTLSMALGTSQLRSESAPPGTEDLAYAEGKTWSACESGSKYMQDGSYSWSGFYPFVFYMKDE